MRTVVDLTPVGLGRRPRDLATLSREAGLHVVAATGYHRAAHYPAWHWAREVDETTLLEVLLTDLLSGMDDRDWSGPLPQPTDVRCGIVKLGASYQRVTGPERRWFTAGATAARRSGVPIAVHCEVGTAAHDVLDLLAAEGCRSRGCCSPTWTATPTPSCMPSWRREGPSWPTTPSGASSTGPSRRCSTCSSRWPDSGRLPSVCLARTSAVGPMLRSYGGGPGHGRAGARARPAAPATAGEEAVRTCSVDAPARLLRLVDPVG
jgi:phosphotriesterase-related protein